jgi:hypothetical protein
VPPGTDDLAVVHGAFPASSQELTILTRSMLQVMADFASQIDVPEQRLARRPGASRRRR